MQQMLKRFEMIEAKMAANPDPDAYVKLAAEYAELQEVAGAIRALEAARRERADLDTRLSELTTDGSSAPDFDENFADSGQVAAEQGEYLTLAANFRDQLAEVEAAIGRLDAGTYGNCEVCGNPIAEPRLEAMPAARYCIDHA